MTSYSPVMPDVLLAQAQEELKSEIQQRRILRCKPRASGNDSRSSGQKLFSSLPESNMKPLSDLEASQAEKSQSSDLSLKLMQKAFLRGANTVASSSESTMESAGLRLSDYHSTVAVSEADDSAQPKKLCPISESGEADEDCEASRKQLSGIRQLEP